MRLQLEPRRVTPVGMEHGSRRHRHRRGGGAASRGSKPRSTIPIQPASRGYWARPTGFAARRFIEGTSWHEIVVPRSFQPSLKSHVEARYTQSGS